MKCEPESREVKLTKERAYVKIKNFGDQLAIVLPNVKDILESATKFPSSEDHIVAGKTTFSEISDFNTRLLVSGSQNKSKTEGTVTIDNALVEIKIEKPVDEATLTNILRLLGQYSPGSLTPGEAQVIRDLIKDRPEISAIKHKTTGVRIVLNIPKETFVPLYGLPPVFNLFTGREKLLSDLESNLRGNQASNEKSESVNVVQLAGPGGGGKTVALNHFARLQFRKKYFHWVVWLNVGDDEKNANLNLLAQLSSLGEDLGFNPKDLKPQVLHRLIFERLASKGRGLVVFDDAPGYAVLKPFLPTTVDQSQIEVYINTRNGISFGPSISKVVLGVFALEDALKYIRRVLKESISDEDAVLLAETLGCYPLALTQALAYINNTECSIKEYCQLYNSKRENRKKLLDTPVYEEDPYHKHDNQLDITMWVVIQLSLERVRALCTIEQEHEGIRLILQNASCLASESPIPKKLLTCLLPEDLSEVDINRLLVTIRTFSLIENLDKRGAYRIHKVIQDVLSIIDRPRNVILAQIAKFIVSYCELEEDPLSDEKRRKTLIPHSEALLKHFKNVEAQGEFDTEISRLLFVVGNSYLLMRSFSEAKRCYDQVLQKPNAFENKIFESELLMNLGVVTSALGDIAKGKSLLEKALAIKERLLGSEDSRVADSLLNLSETVREWGDINSAKALIERAIPLMSRRYRANDSKRVKFLMSLGATNLSLGNAAVAKKLFEEVLSLTQNIYGPDHAEVGQALMNLSSATLSLGKVVEAEKLIRQALSILEAAYGKDHIVVAKCLGGLGAIVQKRGDVAGSIVTTERAIRILERAYGGNHPEVGRVLYELSGAVLEQGERLKAIEISKRAVRILEGAYGPNHPDLARAFANLGTATLSLGNAAEAKTILERALAIKKGFYVSGTHVEVGKTLISLGAATLILEDYQKAIGYLQESLKIIEHNYGPDHIDVAHVLGNLGSALVASDEPKKAEIFFRRARRIYERTYGAEHCKVAKTLVSLADVKVSLKEPEEAINLLQKGLSIFDRVYKGEHPDIGLAHFFWGKALDSLEEFSKALVHLQLSLKVFSRHYGLLHPRTQNVRNFISSIKGPTTIQMGSKNLQLPTSSDSIVGQAESLSRSTVDISNSKLRNWNTEQPAQAIRRATVKGTCSDLVDLLKLFPEQANIPDQTPGKGLTALHWAVKKGFASHVKCLLECIGFTSTEDAQAMSALDYAIQADQTEILFHFRDALLKRYVRYNIHQTELPRLVRACAQNNDVAGLKLLVYLKVLIDEPGPRTGQTALHLAVIKGSVKCVQLLLDAGANPDTQDKEEMTPRDLAINKVEITKLMSCQNNNPVPSTDRNGDVHLSSMSSSAEIRLITVFKQLVENSSPSVEEFLNAAQCCFDNDLILEAMPLIKWILKQELCVDALILLAECQLARHQFEECAENIALCLRLVKSDRKPDRLVALLEKNSRLQQHKKEQEMELKTLMSKPVLLVDDQMEKVTILCSLNRFSDALEMLNKDFAENQPNKLLSSICYKKALCYFALQRYKEARQSLQPDHRIKENEHAESLRKKIDDAILVSPLHKQLLERLSSRSSICSCNML